VCTGTPVNGDAAMVTLSASIDGRGTVKRLSDDPNNIQDYNTFVTSDGTHTTQNGMGFPRTVFDDQRRRRRRQPGPIIRSMIVDDGCMVEVGGKNNNSASADFNQTVVYPPGWFSPENEESGWSPFSGIEQNDNDLTQYAQVTNYLPLCDTSRVNKSEGNINLAIVYSKTQI